MGYQVTMSGPSSRTSKEVSNLVAKTAMQNLAHGTPVTMDSTFTGTSDGLDYNFNMAKVDVNVVAVSSAVTRAQIKTAMLTQLILHAGTTSIAQVESALDGSNNYNAADGSTSDGDITHDQAIDQQRKAILVLDPVIYLLNNPSSGATYDCVIGWRYNGPPLRVGKKRDWTFSQQDGWEWSLANIDESAANDAGWSIDGRITHTGKWFE